MNRNTQNIPQETIDRMRRMREEHSRNVHAVVQPADDGEAPEKEKGDPGSL